jgi:hypothetical protein
MAYYWNESHQRLIERYYYCQTGQTSGQTMNECCTQLLPVLEHISRLCLFMVGLPQTKESIQDCLVRQTTYIMPKLKAELLICAFNYIWLSTKRYLINQKVVKQMAFDTIDDKDYIGDVSMEPDYQQYIEDVRMEILEALDKRIEQQKVINKTHTIFLINMKEYIIKNDYNVAGFKNYIQEKMNIKPSTYSALMSRCGIRSKLFKEKE